MYGILAYGDMTIPAELLHQLPVLLQEVNIALQLLAVPASAHKLEWGPAVPSNSLKPGQSQVSSASRFSVHALM